MGVCQVDKTEMLEYTNKVMNTLQGYICNSRPRRFGKSITANMLTAYYSKGCDSQDLFAGLKISEASDFKNEGKWIVDETMFWILRTYIRLRHRSFAEKVVHDV